MEYKSVYDDNDNPAFEKILNSIEELYGKIEKITQEIQQLDPEALDDLIEDPNSDETEDFPPDFSALEPELPDVDDTADVPGDGGELTVGDDLVPIQEEQDSEGEGEEEEESDDDDEGDED